jgi:hypothetical protein
MPETLAPRRTYSSGRGTQVLYLGVLCHQIQGGCPAGYARASQPKGFDEVIRLEGGGSWASVAGPG